MKKRIDVLLVELALAPSRQRAQSLIMSGNVIVNDEPVVKSGQLVSVESEIRVRGSEHDYVSRGAIKLAAALDAFAVNVEGMVCLDIGASTGGFTEVLLKRGAAKVFAIDVGINQLDWKIRQDKRVVVMEKINARNLPFDAVGQTVGMVVIDVSFISLDKILPATIKFANSDTNWITLIKPQFEVGREKVGKGGIVRVEADRLEAVEKLRGFAEKLGLRRRGLIESPITGASGNKEFLAHWVLERKQDQ